MHRDATAILKTLGQEVAQLVNGEQEAGYHEVKLDGSGLSSGVYADAQVVTREVKMSICLR